MNTRKYYIIVLFICVACGEKVMAQGTYRAGVLPSVNLNYKLKEKWSLNFKAESRQMIQEGTFGGETNRGYDYVLTDFSLIAARKVGLSGRIAGGYLIRFFEDQVIHRAIQQYTYVQNLPRLRLAHRLVTDQTFSSEEDTEFRFRYRLASEIPLNGESADPKEFYLKISNEYLNSVQNSDYNLEIRVVPLLGYTISGHHKIEIGLDYRVDSFLDQDVETRQRFWTSISWYVNF